MPVLFCGHATGVQEPVKNGMDVEGTMVPAHPGLQLQGSLTEATYEPTVFAGHATSAQLEL